MIEQSGKVQTIVTADGTLVIGAGRLPGYGVVTITQTEKPRIVGDRVMEPPKGPNDIILKLPSSKSAQAFVDVVTHVRDDLRKREEEALNPVIVPADLTVECSPCRGWGVIGGIDGYCPSCRGSGRVSAKDGCAAQRIDAKRVESQPQTVGTAPDMQQDTAAPEPVVPNPVGSIGYRQLRDGAVIRPTDIRVNLFTDECKFAGKEAGQYVGQFLAYEFFREFKPTQSLCTCNGCKLRREMRQSPVNPVGNEEWIALPPGCRIFRGDILTNGLGCFWAQNEHYGKSNLIFNAKAYRKKSVWMRMGQRAKTPISGFCPNPLNNRFYRRVEENEMLFTGDIKVHRFVELPAEFISESEVGTTAFSHKLYTFFRAVVTGAKTPVTKHEETRFYIRKGYQAVVIEVVNMKTGMLVDRVICSTSRFNSHRTRYETIRRKLSEKGLVAPEYDEAL